MLLQLIQKKNYLAKLNYNSKHILRSNNFIFSRAFWQSPGHRMQKSRINNKKCLDIFVIFDDNDDSNDDDDGDNHDDEDDDCCS